VRVKERSLATKSLLTTDEFRTVVEGVLGRAATPSPARGT